MKKVFAALLLTVTTFITSYPQDLFYLLENFERTDSSYYWSVDPYIANKTWKYTYGGQWLSGGDPYNPEIPYQGNFNAGIYFPALVLDTVKLITPTLELEGAKKPMLRFWHCQYDKIVKGPDFLKLYFRAGPNSTWDLIEAWTTPIDFWKDEVYDIADLGEKYLTDTFQIAFEGIIGNGYGVYIDSVSVLEEDLVSMFVKNSAFSSVNHTMVPSRATDIPFEKVKIRVLGNSGDAILNSLTVTPQGDGKNYLENNYKLFYTRNDEFAPYVADTSTLVATGSLTGGNIVFNNIGFEMLLGDNNFWIAGSIDSTLHGQATLSFTIPANGIHVNDTTFPSVPAVFTETHDLIESVLYDDFESGATGWTLQGNFEVGWPEGTQVDIQANPNTPYNGQNILDTDLDGGYYPNINSGTAYYAYTPELDLTYYINIAVYMQSYFSVNGPDNAVIDISTDGGATWQNVWASDPASNNSYWSEFLIETINDAAKRNPSFQLRFGITGSMTVPWPGLSIDNFAIMGEKLYTDIGVTQILEPHNDCRDCGNDTVKAWFRNYADGNAPNVIPVFYGLWGSDSVLVHDTIYGGIAKDDSVLFTFGQLAGFPIGDYYNDFVVGVDLPIDQDASNDQLTKALVIQNNDVPPHFDNFEYHGGIWLPSDSSTWENRNMSGTIETDPLSPKIWVLSPTGNYAGNDTSFVTSGCFNLSDISRNIIRLKYWSDSEEGVDGARVEYTLNDGVTWNIVDDTLHGTGWNWTSEAVTSLGSNGWSGQNEWSSSKALLPAMADAGSKVKFRVIFMSDANNSYPQGFAFDDFEIFPAPPDIGVSSISLPNDACQGVNTSTTSLYVKNYGYNKLDANDTILIGLDFENQSPILDSFTLGSDLLPGDSILRILNTNFDLSVAKAYNIKAYTLIEDDPFYYLTNNDTLDYTFNVWPNPRIILPDTIGSRQPDTLVIVPQYPDWVTGYTYLWQDNVTTDSIFDVDVEGLHWVTATEPEHGCYTTDSVQIVLLYFDAGATGIVSPQSTCELDTAELIQIRVANVGTDSIIAGDKIAVSYTVNGGITVMDTLTVAQTLRYNNSIVYTFADDPYDFSVNGSYTIEATATYVGGDENVTNDSISEIVDVFGYTPLDLGPDLVVQALSHTIDAGTGFVDYLWNTGATTNTITINNSGTYWVDAIDANGCPGNDSVDIWLKIRDVQANMLVTPQSSCNREAPEEVQIRIVNNGTDTILTTQTVNIKFSVNGGSYVSETFNPNYDIVPYAQYTHQFSSFVDISAFQTYTFDIVATSDGDLRTGNDSLHKEIVTNENPTINFGEDQVVNDYQYILDAGTGVNYKYLWQDNVTNTQTYLAEVTGNYWCTITDSVTGCYESDTIFILFDINDYSVQSLDLPSQVCQGIEEGVSVDLQNKGSLARTSAVLTLAFEINGSEPVTEQFNINSLWMPGTTKTVTFTAPFPFTTVSTTVVDVYLYNHTDLNPGNDATTKNVTVVESPDVDFGGDTLEVEFPYQLDAGNHESYQWQDNSTNRYLTVYNPGLYSVIVTNAANCDHVELVYVDQLSFINEAAAEKLDVNLYPNPASEFLTVELNIKSGEEIIVELLDITNHVIFSDKHSGFAPYNHRFDVSSMSKGIYFLRFRNNEVYQVSKIIIQ